MPKLRSSKLFHCFRMEVNMLVFSVILGVLLILAGFSFIFTPLASLMSVGYFIIILFFIAGLYNLIRGIREKDYGFGFIFGIISVILGIVMLFIPDATPATVDGTVTGDVATDVALANSALILYVAAAWFFVKGIVTIWTSFQARKLGAGTGTFACGLLLGILEILLTVYSCLHPLVLAVAIAILIGIYFIEAGISIIAIAGTVDRMKSAVTGAAFVDTMSGKSSGSDGQA